MRLLKSWDHSVAACISIDRENSQRVESARIMCGRSGHRNTDQRRPKPQWKIKSEILRRIKRLAILRWFFVGYKKLLFHVTHRCLCQGFRNLNLYSCSMIFHFISISSFSCRLYYHLYRNYYRKMKIYLIGVNADRHQCIPSMQWFSRDLLQRPITVEFSEEGKCKPLIRKFWPEYYHKSVLLYFVSSSHIITPASRAKEPLVSQLLHSEQAPKWCIIISTIPVRHCFQSCSSNHKEKFRSWSSWNDFVPHMRVYNFGVIKPKKN